MDKTITFLDKTSTYRLLPALVHANRAYAERIDVSASAVLDESLWQDLAADGGGRRLQELLLLRRVREEVGGWQNQAVSL